MRSICYALRQPSLTSYSDLLKELCLTDNAIFYIENPHLLIADDKSLLMDAIKYILHSKECKLKVVIEFDTTYRCKCFLDPLITLHNTYIAPFKKTSVESFDEHLKSLVIAPEDVFDELMSYSEQNFLKLNDVLLMLVEKGIAHYGQNGEIVCAKIHKSDLKQRKENDIDKQYKLLDEARQRTIRYSALMGSTVFSSLLQSPLNIESPEQILCDIEATTGWIEKEDTLDFWQLIFQDSSIYSFKDETTIKGLRNYSTPYEKDDTYLKLAKYLEAKYLKSPDTDRLLHRAGIVFSMIGYYYRRYDRSKSVEYNRKAGDCYARYNMYQSAAKHYDYCFRNTDEYAEKVLYFHLLLQSLIDAELIQEALSWITDKLIHDSKLMSEPQLCFLYAEVLYRVGKPVDCLDILLSLEKGFSIFKKVDYLSFKVCSLLASAYDWLNDNKNRKRYFNRALKMHKRLPEEYQKLALCQIYKKANMHFDFGIPEIRKMMKSAYEYYVELRLCKDAYECAHNIGLSYMFLCDFNEATKYLSISLDGFADLKSHEIYVPLNSIGILNMLEGKFDEAVYYFSRICTDVIEPFCAYSVLINKVICEIRLEKPSSEIYVTLSQLNSLEKTDEIEFRLPYVNLQIAKAFFAKREGKLEDTTKYFTKALSLCDEKNDNFLLPGVLCAKMLSEMKGDSISIKTNPYVTTNNKLSNLCMQTQIIICDFLFWK